MARPSKEEMMLLKRFKEQVEDLDLTDGQSTYQNLLRWIRARNHNLQKAEEMLRKSIAWRKENDIDSVLSWTPPEDIIKRCPLKMEGHDEDNAPILISFLGRVDMKRIYQLGLREDYLRFSSQLFERVLDKCKGKVSKDKYPVSQFILICDMDQFSTSTFLCKGAVNMSIDYLKIFEANYPETLKKFVLINANSVTLMMYNIVKHIMSPQTAAKFQMFGTDAKKWQDYLLGFIPASQLCSRFGGTMKCQSAICCSPTLLEINAEDFLSVCVEAGKQFKVEFSVTEVNTTIMWSLQIEAFDLYFHITCDGGMVMPEKRIFASDNMEDDAMVCERSGRYEFIFSNMHSRYRSKELKLQVKLIPPPSS